jgi:ferredoxin-NADP reductase
MVSPMHQSAADVHCKIGTPEWRYLTDELCVGDRIDLRGPSGLFFWNAKQ